MADEANKGTGCGVGCLGVIDAPGCTFCAEKGPDVCHFGSANGQLAKYGVENEKRLSNRTLVEIKAVATRLTMLKCTVSCWRQLIAPDDVNEAWHVILVIKSTITSAFSSP